MLHVESDEIMLLFCTSFCGSVNFYARYSIDSNTLCFVVPNKCYTICGKVGNTIIAWSFFLSLVLFLSFFFFTVQTENKSVIPS